jgi:integrase
VLMLDAGLRVGEVLALEWGDVHREPVGAEKLGYIHLRSGKTRNAKRNVALAARVRQIARIQAELLSRLNLRWTSFQPQLPRPSPKPHSDVLGHDKAPWLVDFRQQIGYKQQCCSVVTQPRFLCGTSTVSCLGFRYALLSRFHLRRRILGPKRSRPFRQLPDLLYSFW